MSPPNTDDELIIIGCPSCRERFKVEEEFIGSRVECGNCEHQFEITHNEVIKGKKFYPGEGKSPGLEKFHRAQPAKIDHDLPVPMAPQQAPVHQHHQVEPTSPMRVMLGLMGGLAIAFMAMIMILGAKRGGMLDGVTTDKRLVMSGFVAVIGFILIVCANPNARIRAVLIGMLAAGGLAVIPLFFTDGSIPLGVANPENSGETTDEHDDPKSKKLSVEQLREQFGIGPLESEIQRLALSGSNKRAIGIWFKNLRSSNRYLVRDYIIRVTNADYESHFYPRGNDTYLMVVTGITLSMDEMQNIMNPLGTVEEVHEELQVIETLVDNESFQSKDMEKLTDPKNPMFYHLNNEELSSVDLERVSAAVNRLAEAEPTILRADITGRLIYLMQQDWVDFKDDVAAALSVWASDPGPASEAALEAAKKMRLNGETVPLEVIQLVVDKGNTNVIPLLNILWNENPSKWELIYAEVGPAAEDLMVQNLKEATGVHRDSAIKILGRIGGVIALDLLTEMDQPDVTGETKILIRNAISLINKRLGE